MQSINSLNTRKEIFQKVNSAVEHKSIFASLFWDTDQTSRGQVKEADSDSAMIRPRRAMWHPVLEERKRDMIEQAKELVPPKPSALLTSKAAFPPRTGRAAVYKQTLVSGSEPT